MTEDNSRRIVEELCEGPRMTYEMRERIFSKEVLTITDVMLLFGLNYQPAAQLVRNIRRKHDRLGLEGKLHVQDYLDYFNLSGNDKRYSRREENDYGEHSCGAGADHVEDPLCGRGSA